MDTRIRPAEPDDAAALGSIQVASHLATYRGVMPDAVLARLTADRLSAAFRARLVAAAESPAPSQRRLWVIESKAAIVGYAATEPGASAFLPPPEGAGEIESLYLQPEAKGQGLGRALHQHAVDDLWRRGFDPLVLWAFEANHQALRFYERAGWTRDVTGEHWVLGGERCPIVRYRLDRSHARSRA